MYKIPKTAVMLSYGVTKKSMFFDNKYCIIRVLLEITTGEDWDLAEIIFSTLCFDPNLKSIQLRYSDYLTH